ncbi:ATP-binding protein [Chromobacterium violaceum]|uniref:ATPase AAA-type core domain-containing protein n=1 Tax=Chromobacterium violaceum (strain ATCC 12472 / DSM 30191 / JCM 1249 / CCUG 213 / NBRC 12614 / NCIMB 9131 / NCTC 9757 / MK) TaxID=243365 RepID=Q7P0C8_CHRVO|nr:ATP-binding protein [Chromobacterium violaceum]AAQ58315.1 hypothetical protein CV_0639 [Chromobacterium violaceum ATCC 12472]SUX40101.1 Uncharacterized conserved protein [Chromobacterium violaceum]
MKISIENIGKIKSTSILLDGFTVIAGENDSGKSTVGKIVYSIIQAFSIYPQFRKEKIRRKTSHSLRFFITELRRNFDLTKHDSLRQMMSFSFVNHIMADPDDALYEIRGVLDKLEESYPEKLETLIKLKSRLYGIQREIDSLSESDDIFESITDLMQSEFGGEIDRKQDSRPPSFEINDGETTVISAKFSDGIITDGIYSGGLGLGLGDATYIDGASILQYAHLINLNDSDPRLPFHITDLARKLISPTLVRGGSSNLADIYKGRLVFDETQNSFYFDKGGYRVCLNNIASGIKNIGVLDLLVKKGVICDGSLLVLDEPEINLHPKWQTQLAKIICELHQAGVYILLTTHSPYMIEALHYYANVSGIKSNFYLACKSIANPDDVDFIDLSMNVGAIIEDLAQPLWDIVEDNNEF